MTRRLQLTAIREGWAWLLISHRLDSVRGADVKQ
jgi:hypothetical protein